MSFNLWGGLPGQKIPIAAAAVRMTLINIIFISCLQSSRLGRKRLFFITRVFESYVKMDVRPPSGKAVALGNFIL